MWLMNTRSLQIHGTIVPMGCMLLRVVDCPNRTVRPAYLSQPSGVAHPRGPVLWRCAMFHLQCCSRAL